MRPQRVLQRLSPIFGVAVFAVALAVLHRELAHLHVHEVAGHLRSIPATIAAAAVGLTVISYLVLTLYDVLSVRYVGARLPYRRIALASFVGYAFSQNVGFTLVSGAPVRFRMYTAWGLSAMEVTTLVAFNAVSFWLGMLGVGGVALLLAGGQSPAALHLPFTSLRPLGALAVLPVAAYITLCALRRAPIEVGRWRWELPPARLALGQLVVAFIDWTIAAAVLFVLLPLPSHHHFVHFLAAFMLAQAAGLISQVPGGLGVFETVVLLVLPDSISAGAALGSLVAYRVIYYLLPLVVAASLLLAYEFHQRRAAVGRIARTVGSGLSLVVPRVLAMTTFLGGVVLLVSGATPAVGGRLQWLERLLPLPVVEFSHFLGSIAGVLLLLLSWGLRRRLESAYYLTLLLLGAGVAVSLMKGLDFEEAAILAVMMVALAPARGYFYRTAPLLSEPLSTKWLAAVAMALAGAFWVGLFAYRHVAYAGELWWQFELHGDASRSLRGGIGVAVGLMLFGIARLLGPAAPHDREPSAEDLERVRGIVADSPNSSANLALLGDKRFLISDSGRAMVMYGVEGRSWIAMGGPIGAAEEHAELVWRFHAMCDRHGGWTVFYEVGEENLDLYLELGLSVLKIGEEGTVPLADFSLDGSEHKGLRHTRRKLQREGCTCEVVERQRVAELLPELRTISDAWLEDKHTREKRFSLGWFDEEYLEQLPVAIVRQRGKIVAFANLWPGAPGGELSIDLMRHLPDAPRGVMDFLFTHLMEWGRDRGFSSFSLGMAPLAGIRTGPFAPLWNQLASLAYRYGDYFYNFQGLRMYKDKFDPVWRPRFLVCPGGAALPGVLADLASLISGGLLGVLRK